MSIKMSVLTVLGASALIGFLAYHAPTDELRSRLRVAPLRSVIEGGLGAKWFVSGRASEGGWRWLHTCGFSPFAWTREVDDIGGSFAWRVRRVVYPDDVGYDDARKQCPSMYD